MKICQLEQILSYRPLCPPILVKMLCLLHIWTKCVVPHLKKVC